MLRQFLRQTFGTAFLMVVAVGLFAAGNADRARAQSTATVQKVSPPPPDFQPDCSTLPPPPPQSGTPVYTNSTTLGDFTSTVTEYAQFVRGDTGGSLSPAKLPYTPTTAILSQPPGVWSIPTDRIEAHQQVCAPGFSLPPFLAMVVKFSAPVSRILVFPSIDHPGKGWDAFQYSIWGLTPTGTAVTYTLLFNPTNVIGINDPFELTDPHFTLGQWQGIGPTTVNNWFTPGLSTGNQTIGYEAYFDFGSSNAFQYFAFVAASLSPLEITQAGADHEAELAAVAAADPSPGQLKICKVAGPGVPVGTMTTFMIGYVPLSVPAGPSPGGTCVLGPTFPVGTVATVTEVLAGDTVLSIGVAPAGQLVGAPNLSSGSVSVTIGGGVTEVTYADKRTGFLEICKAGDVKGSFTFTVNPGNLGPFVVPAGGCSPSIEVTPGSVSITETPSRTSHLAGCATIPPGRQGFCVLRAPGASNVQVVPGDISSQTIAIIRNAP